METVGRDLSGLKQIIFPPCVTKRRVLTAGAVQRRPVTDLGPQTIGPKFLAARELKTRA